MRNKPTPIAKYLEKYKLSSTALGHRMAEHMGGRTPGAVALSQWKNGRNLPLPDAMQAMRLATRGEVTPNDWVDWASNA